MASMFYWVRKKQIMEIPLFTPLSPFDCTADRHLFLFFSCFDKETVGGILLHKHKHCHIDLSHQ